MRDSPLRHPLSVLRKVIGLTQQELADLVQRSRPTIQAIELGKLRLSEELARRIAYRTGVSMIWLMQNGPQSPPISFDGRPFTRDTFESERASFNRPATRQGELEAIRLAQVTAVEKLAATCSRAYQADQVWLWTYKVEELLNSLVSQFGEDASIKALAVRYYPEMKKRRPVVQPIIDKLNDDILATAKKKAQTHEHKTANPKALLAKGSAGKSKGTVGQKWSPKSISKYVIGRCAKEVPHLK